MSPDGIGNLAPFSFFNGVSSNPPCIVISVTRKSDGSKKDTLVNIERTGEFVVNIVADWMIEPPPTTARPSIRTASTRCKRSGSPRSTPSASRPKRVKESPIHMECVLHQFVEVGDGSQGSATLVIGRVQLMHVHKPALHAGKIDVAAIRPMARLAGAHARDAVGGDRDPRPLV